MTQPMTVETALELIANGHAVYDRATCEEVCAALGVKPPERWSTFKSDPPGTFKGLTMAPGNEGMVGHTALGLGEYIVRALGVVAQEKMGRGSQGRAYAEAIKGVRA